MLAKTGFIVNSSGDKTNRANKRKCEQGIIFEFDLGQGNG